MIFSHETIHTNRSDKIEAKLKQIIFFLLLAFLIPLICVILMKYTANSVLALILLGVEAASPSLAAVATVIFFESGSGLRKLFKKCYVDHLDLKLVLVGLVLPAVVIFASKLVYWLFFDITPNFGILTAKKAMIACWALVAEELGWRGFLQGKLETYLNKFTLPLLLGIIWALWHYHFFISGEMSAPILLFTLGCIADSYLYFAFTKAVSDNIVPASVLHFSENLFLILLPINPEFNNGSFVPYLLYVAGLLIAAAISFSVALKHMKKAQL